MSAKPAHALLVLSSIALGACGTIAPGASSFQARAPVSAIDTDQTAALRCLGRLIERSARGPVEVVIGKIRDRTIPPEFRDRRLSKGSEWWVHTAISNMKTSKVRSLEQGSRDSAQGRRQLLFEGAWTQDDRIGVEGDGEFSASIGSVAFSVGGDLEYDLIVGDFTSVEDGRVTYASAVGVVIGAGSGDTDFFIRDGLNSYAFDLGAGVTEGAQMAQRQVTEAAVAAHLAAYYGVDLRACLLREASSQAYKLTGYAEASEPDRNRSLQRALKQLGYYRGKIDGIWGPQSAAALQAFAQEARLPVSPKPTASLYKAVQQAARRTS